MNNKSKVKVMPAVKLLSEVIEKKVNSELKGHDVTVVQLRILGIIASSEAESVSLKELEGALHASQATVAGIVSRLEGKKLIDSFFEPDDKRVKKVKLTEQGKTLIEQTKGKILEMELALTSNFSDNEREEFIRLLYKMYDTIK